AAVNRSQRRDDAADRLRLLHPLPGHDLALDEPRHQPALRLHELDDFGTDADGRCGERGLVLDPTVDAEETGLVACDAQHVHLAVVELDLQVVVGDPAAEHADPGVSPRPDPLDDVLMHRAILNCMDGSSRGVRVAVTGSSGLIGSALLPVLRREGHEPLRVVRREPAAPDEIGWDPEAGTIDAHGLAGVDAI